MRVGLAAWVLVVMGTALAIGCKPSEANGGAPVRVQEYPPSAYCGYDCYVRDCVLVAPLEGP